MGNCLYSALDRTGISAPTQVLGADCEMATAPIETTFEHR
jgi:hypothetical protein